jgi:hypothetical protein
MRAYSSWSGSSQWCPACHERHGVDGSGVAGVVVQVNLEVQVGSEAVSGRADVAEIWRVVTCWPTVTLGRWRMWQ